MSEADRSINRLVERMRALSEAVERARSVGEPVQLLEAIAELRHVLDALERQAVVDAREADPPARWQEIADALGVSRQTAHEKHASPRARPKGKPDDQAGP